MSQKHLVDPRAFSPDSPLRQRPTQPAPARQRAPPAASPLPCPARTACTLRRWWAGPCRQAPRDWTFHYQVGPINRRPLPPRLSPHDNHLNWTHPQSSVLRLQSPEFGQIKRPHATLPRPSSVMLQVTCTVGSGGERGRWERSGSHRIGSSPALADGVQGMV